MFQVVVPTKEDGRISHGESIIAFRRRVLKVAQIALNQGNPLKRYSFQSLSTFWLAYFLSKPCHGYGVPIKHMASERKEAKLPNILITGTPGTGKTSTAELIAEKTGFTHINCGDWVKDRNCHDGWDDEFDCYILNEDKLLDEMEPEMAKGGQVVDFHTCDFFPERFFQLVVVLRTDNSVLYPRLQGRHYKEKKISENMEAEIMQVVLDEARESYANEIVVELKSDDIDQLEENVARVQQWIKNYMDNQAKK